MKQAVELDVIVRRLEKKKLALTYRIKTFKKDIEIDKQYLASLKKQIDEMANNITALVSLKREEAPDAILAFGGLGSYTITDYAGVMYDNLFLDKIRDQLEEIKPKSPLIISTEIPEIPWEILYDGEEFWGIRYVMGRALISPKAKRRKKSLPHDKIRFLFISNPCADERMKNSAKEVEKLIESLPEGTEYHCLSRERADFTSIQLALSKGYDVIHYSGHVGFDKNKKIFIPLFGNGKIYSDQMTRSLHGSPLVFLNGCWSDSLPGGGGITITPSTLISSCAQTLAKEFLNAGAIAVIGTLWKVTDRGACEFSEKFYNLLFQGESIGESLRAAREKSRKERKSDLTWAAYVLYGDPRISIVKRQKGKPVKIAHKKAVEAKEIKKEINFNRKAEKVLIIALLESRILKHDFMGTPHLFSGLTKIENGMTQRILSELGMSPLITQKIRRHLRSQLKTQEVPSDKEVGVSRNFLRIIKSASAEAGKARRKEITDTDLFLSLLRNEEASVTKILKEAGVDAKKAVEILQQAERQKEDKEEEREKRKEEGEPIPPIRICILSGPEDGTEYKFYKTSIIIGRAAGDLILSYDSSVSRRHARIFQDGKSYRLEDLKSTNGTYIDGEKVTARPRIIPANIVRVGRTELRLKAEG